MILKEKKRYIIHTYTTERRSHKHTTYVHTFLANWVVFGLIGSHSNRTFDKTKVDCGENVTSMIKTYLVRIAKMRLRIRVK